MSLFKQLGDSLSFGFKAKSPGDMRNGTVISTFCGEKEYVLPHFESVKRSCLNYWCSEYLYLLDIVEYGMQAYENPVVLHRYQYTITQQDILQFRDKLSCFAAEQKNTCLDKLGHLYLTLFKQWVSNSNLLREGNDCFPETKSPEISSFKKKNILLPVILGFVFYLLVCSFGVLFLPEILVDLIKSFGILFMFGVVLFVVLKSKRMCKKRYKAILDFTSFWNKQNCKVVDSMYLRTESSSGEDTTETDYYCPVLQIMKPDGTSVYYICEESFSKSYLSTVQETVLNDDRVVVLGIERLNGRSLPVLLILFLTVLPVLIFFGIMSSHFH